MKPFAQWRLTPQTALIVLLLGGFALSMIGLTRQSLWVDEGFTWFATRHDLLPLLRSDAHPPLYFAAVTLWTWLAGSSELALRYFSVLGGILSLALAAALAHTLRPPHCEATRWLACVTVLCMALSDMQGYIAQEARPYTWHVALACISLLALLHYGRSQRTHWWFAWVLASLALLYTQYYGAWLLVVQGLYVLVVWRGRIRWAGVGALALVGLLFLPWVVGMIVPYQLAATSAHTRTDTSDVATLLRYLSAYFSGQWVLTGGIALVGLGLAWRTRTERTAITLMWGWLVIAVAIPFVLNFFSGRLLFDYRLSQIVPAVALVIAFGWVRFPAQVRPFLLAVMLVYGLLFVDAYRPKEDWRGFSQQIAAMVTAEDAVVVDFGGGDFQMSYYLERDLPRAVPCISLRQLAQLAPTTYEGDALAFMDASAVIWLVRWNSSNDALDKLAFTGHVLTGEILIATDNGMNLVLRRYERLTDAPLALFGEQITLQRASLNPTSLVTHLVWSATQPLDVAYTTSVQILDAAGMVVAQQDSSPLPATPTWAVNMLIWDLKQPVTPDGTELPPGRYRVVVQVYTLTPDGIANLPVNGQGEPFLIGTFDR